MIKNKYTIITLFSFLAIFILFDNSMNNNIFRDKTKVIDNREKINKLNIDIRTTKESSTLDQITVNSKASEFVKNLKSGEKLSLFFNSSWIFIYHEDNRCDGSTDGQIQNLKSTQIDSIIRLQVKNDGDGWACDKNKPKTIDLDFYLKKKITDWHRFEIPNYKNQERNILYVLGSGESDYLKLHYNDNYLIIKLEYRSEDPG